jgi:hypothetical protein
LTPDVIVRVTSKDVAEGRDPEVAAVRKLVTRASDGPRRGIQR